MGGFIVRGRRPRRKPPLERHRAGDDVVIVVGIVVGTMVVVIPTIVCQFFVT